MRTVTLSKALIAASDRCIAHQQTLSGAGNVLLNGGSVTTRALGSFGADIAVAVLDTQRRVAVISDGDDSARSITLNGFRQGGQPISEVLALTNAGTAVSVLDYFEVGPTLSVDGAIANHITIGTIGTGSTDWIMPNFHLTPFEIDTTQQISGAVTWNLETTNDFGWWNPPQAHGTTPQPNVTEVVQGATLAVPTPLTTPVTGYRYTITAGTGTLTAQNTQAGITNL